MLNIKKHEIILDKVEWEYFVCGKGKPLVIVPAFHSDITRFKPLVKYLSQYFQVILPHLPGISNTKSLGEHSYTAKNYARFLNLFIDKLDLKDYLLAGFCLGGTIITRMLEMGLKKPSHLLIFEGIYDAKFIHLKPLYSFLKKIILQFGPENRVLKALVELVLHDERALTWYLKFTYGKEKNLEEVIKHQIEITKIMASRAYLEVIYDIFTTHLSKEKLQFKVPTTLIYNQYDNLIDVEPTIKGMQTIFPNSEVLRVDLTEHSPSGAISLKVVQKMIVPLEKKIIQLSK